MIALLAYATYVERINGTTFVAKAIYHTPWFFAWWTTLTIVSIIYMAGKHLHQHIPLFVLHGAFVVILVGAAVTFLTGKEGKIHLRQDVAEQTYLDKQSNEMTELPFTLTLKSFTIQHYPGTDAPSDFVSNVVCYGNHSKDTLNVNISMNNIMSIDGYRFYQSEFDSDKRGSTLSVNYDPWGTSITYAGYILLALGMLLTLLFKYGEFRRLLTSPILKKGLFMCILAFGCLHTHAENVPTINADKAQIVARYQVVYNNRVVPLNTVAIDFLQKIYGKHSYRGLAAEQVLYGWLAKPEVWKKQKLIKIKNKELRKQLGISGKYASMQDLFNENGTYKLMPLIHLEQKQDALGKAIVELDEKTGLILMLTNNTLFQPLPPHTPQLSDMRVEAEILYNRIPAVNILFILNLSMGFFTFFLIIYRLISHQSYAQKESRVMHSLWNSSVAILVLSLLFSLITYILRWYVGSRVPLSNGYETMLLLSLLLMIITLALQNRFSFVLPVGFLLSGLTLLVSYIGSMDPQITQLMPVLHSPLLSIHVCIIMTAYALLALMMLQGIFALWITSRKTSSTYTEVICQQVYTLSRIMLYPALFLLAAGIFLGAVWANVSWGKYWSWDPKETWALITLMLYAVPTHHKSLPWVNHPRYFHIYIIVAFLAVLMTYFGVNYFLGGMHAYA